MVEHIVALSGGKDSTAMALRLRYLHPDVPYRFVITPTGNELPDMVAHWERLETLLGMKLEILPCPKLEPLMERMDMLPSTRMRWCTRMIKIEPFVALYSGLPAGSMAYVGLRADEPPSERGGLYGSAVQQVFPLREWGWGIAEVTGYLKSRGVTIPRRTDCAFCPYQRADEWFQLWRDHRDVFMAAEAWEARLGHTFRSPTGKHGRWKASLAGMREQFESGMMTREEKKRLAQFAAGDDPEDGPCRVCRV